MMAEKKETLFSKSGDVLRRLRLKQQMTQMELATALGLHSQFVSNWERGLCAPPEHCHKHLAKVLKFKENEREQFFEAISEDQLKVIQKKYGWLI